MLISKIKTTYELARGGNALVTAIAVWVGGTVGAETFSAVQAVAGGLAAALIAAWGNAINDIYDRELDARRKQHRPIPSGRVSVRAAAWQAAVFALAGILIAGWINVEALVIASATALLLWLYSFRLKGWLVAGNLAVSFLSGLSFLFGAVVQNTAIADILPQGWYAFGFAFLWHLGREWVKAAEDVEEDREAGLRTLAVVYGPKAAGRAASLVLTILLLGLWQPYLDGYFNSIYLMLVLVGVVPVLCGSIVTLWQGCDVVRLQRIAGVLKWDMLVGVLAIWMGLA